MTNAALEHSDLWKSSDELLYATIKIDNHFENHQLESGQFRQWLSKLFYDEFGEAPSDNTLKDTVRVLSGNAQHNGKTFDTFARVGYADLDTIFVDPG